MVMRASSRLGIYSRCFSAGIANIEKKIASAAVNTFVASLDDNSKIIVRSKIIIAE
jgi:hypothetical protein